MELALPEPPAESKVPKGNFRITEARVLKYGPALGCNACEGLPVEHSQECKDRFGSLVCYHFHD